MSLLPGNATYAEEVADYFLAFRGSGVSLSALDAELVLSWHDAGVPYEVVCRGIRRAVESASRDRRPGEPAIRSLRACRRSVAEEFRRFSGLAVGRAPAGKAKIEAAPEAAGRSRLSKARAALKKALKEGEGGAPARAAALGRVVELARAEPMDPAAASQRIRWLDEALALLYLRALPFAQRLALLRQARQTLGMGRSGMSPRALRASLRAHRVIAARAHGDLPSLK